MTDWTSGCQVRDLTWQLSVALLRVGSATRQPRSERRFFSLPWWEVEGARFIAPSRGRGHVWIPACAGMTTKEAGFA